MSPDHHLLSAAHESIPFGPLLAVFKAMLKLSEAGTTGRPVLLGLVAVFEECTEAILCSSSDFFSTKISTAGRNLVLSCFWCLK